MYAALKFAVCPSATKGQLPRVSWEKYCLGSEVVVQLPLPCARIGAGQDARRASASEITTNLDALNVMCFLRILDRAEPLQPGSIGNERHGPADYGTEFPENQKR